jgi:hypothetical protein
MDRRDFLNLSAALPYPMFFSGTLPKEEKPLEYFSTGFPTLDACMKGGIRPGELCFVYGETGSGKSAFCKTVATTHNAWDIEHPVEGSHDLLMLGNDDTKKALFSNYFCEEFSQSNWKTKYEFVREMREFAAEMNVAIIWTCPISRLTKDDTEELYRESHIKILDYLITLDNSPGRKRLKLLKNRYGPCEEIPIYFAYANNRKMSMNQLY